MPARNSAGTTVKVAVVALAVLAVLAVVVAVAAAVLGLSRKESYIARPCHTRNAIVYQNVAFSKELSNPYTDTNPARRISLVYVLPDEPRLSGFDPVYGNPTHWDDFIATADHKHAGGIWFAKPGEIWQVQVRTTAPDGKAVLCQNYRPKKVLDKCKSWAVPICWRTAYDEFIPENRKIFEQYFLPPPTKSPTKSPRA